MPNMLNEIKAEVDAQSDCIYLSAWFLPMLCIVKVRMLLNKNTSKLYPGTYKKDHLP